MSIDCLLSSSWSSFCPSQIGRRRRMSKSYREREKGHVHFLVSSASNSNNHSANVNKQPCLVCHEESSGYHFGAYTCESCKAFYRRVTKGKCNRWSCSLLDTYPHMGDEEARIAIDSSFYSQSTRLILSYVDPRIEIKHSCEIPLPNITKSNRKDCRACRKAKCDRVGMTAMPKDRSCRTSNKGNNHRSTTIVVTDLLEQLARDLAYDQSTASTALDTLLRLIDLPTLNPINIDCHALYINAMRTWRHQYTHTSTILSNMAFTDTFVVLLFLFRMFMILTEHDDDKSIHNSKFDKLVSILQQEIHRLTGIDHRSACRIKALFMKSYVALAQSSTNIHQHDNSNLSQATFTPYQQYPVYGQ
jgi:hypothetical protein